MSAWLTMIAAGALTYATRLSLILLFGRIEVPGWLARALRFVPAAVLTAIVFPELFIQNGSPEVSLANGRLIAGVLAALVAWRTKNVLLTILAGMAALLALQRIF